MPYSDLQKLFITVPFRYLYSKDTSNLREYDLIEGKFGNKLDKRRPQPFKIFRIDQGYDSSIGLTLAEKEKSGETEEGTSCLIL